MRNLILIIGLVSFISYGEVKKATYDEVKNSINFVEKAIKEGNENIIDLLSEAIEIEKRATTQYYAEKIKEKICKTGKIKESEFNNLRKNFSFFDISLAWAINQIKGKEIDRILKEKEDTNWIDILNRSDLDREKLKEKIKELNPKSKSF